MIFKFRICKNTLTLFGLVTNINENKLEHLSTVVNYKILNLLKSVLRKIHVLLQFIWADNLHNLNPLKSTPPNSFSSAWPVTIDIESLKNLNFPIWLTPMLSLTFIKFFLNECWQVRYLRFKKKEWKLVPHLCGQERAVSPGRRKQFPSPSPQSWTPLQAWGPWETQRPQRVTDTE